MRKTTIVLPEMTPEELEIVTALAVARWMVDYDATEKSFFRLKSGLRKIRIIKAYELMKMADKLGLSFYFGSK